MQWDVKTFITSYFMWAFQLVIFLLAKFVFIRDPGTTPETADIWTGKSEVDAE